MGFREGKSLRETQRLQSFIPRRSLRQETSSEASKICIFRGRGSFRDQSGIYLLLFIGTYFFAVFVMEGTDGRV